MFVRHGYLGATTDEVAARAAVSKQTLYKHFADKQHLFAEVILDTTVQVVDGLSARSPARWTTRRTCARVCATWRTASCAACCSRTWCGCAGS